VYVTTGLGAATLIMAGLSLYWTFASPGQKSASVGVGPGSVLLQGKF
jgi:hypothetical protein